MNSTPIQKLSFVCVFIVLFFTSCHKVSNELKPYYEEISFQSTLDFNGSTLLIIDVDQTIQVGDDSLKLTITNPNSTNIDSMQMLVYLQMADEFDQTLDFKRIVDVVNLLPLSDTTLTLISHPELPVTEDQIKFVLLNQAGLQNNVLNGAYDGIVGFLNENDTLPTSSTFCKGVISADGNFEFWMRLSETEKKFSGQFVDTTNLNAIYSSSPDVINSSADLDTISAGQNFELSGNQLNYRIKLNGQAIGTENRIWFELNK